MIDFFWTIHMLFELVEQIYALTYIYCYYFHIDDVINKIDDLYLVQGLVAFLKKLHCVFSNHITCNYIFLDILVSKWVIMTKFAISLYW